MPSGGHSRCKGLEMGSGLLQWRKRKWAVGLGTNDGGVGWGLAECGKGCRVVFQFLGCCWRALCNREPWSDPCLAECCGCLRQRSVVGGWDGSGETSQEAEKMEAQLRVEAVKLEGENSVEISFAGDSARCAEW